MSWQRTSKNVAKICKGQEKEIPGQILQSSSLCRDLWKRSRCPRGTDSRLDSASMTKRFQGKFFQFRLWRLAKKNHKQREREMPGDSPVFEDPCKTPQRTWEKDSKINTFCKFPARDCKEHETEMPGWILQVPCGKIPEQLFWSCRARSLCKVPSKKTSALSLSLSFSLSLCKKALSKIYALFTKNWHTIFTRSPGKLPAQALEKKIPARCP